MEKIKITKKEAKALFWLLMNATEDGGTKELLSLYDKVKQLDF